MAFKIGSKVVIDNNQIINPNDTYNSGGFNKRNYFYNPSDGYPDDSDAWGRGINDDSDIGFISLANVQNNAYDPDTDLAFNGDPIAGREVGNGWKLYSAYQTSGTSNTTTFTFDDLIYNGDTTYDTSLDNLHYFCFYNPHFSSGFGNNSWQFFLRFSNSSSLRSALGDYRHVYYQGNHGTSTEAVSAFSGSYIPLTDFINHANGGDGYSDFAFIEVEIHDASSTSLMTTVKWRSTTADGFFQGQAVCTHVEKHVSVTFYQGFSTADRKVIDDVIIAGAAVGTANYNTG